jgi:endonuclease YncB( thermonuclease family)
MICSHDTLTGRLVGLAAAVFLLQGTTALAEDALKGTARAIDGARLSVAGQDVRLADIAVPEMGSACLVRGKTFDCGRLAWAGLMDITAGAQVICRKAGAHAHRCAADGYDLSYGQLHAGWAVALDGAPDGYRSKMDEARQRKRGLWAARSPCGGKPFTSLLTR